MQALFSKLCRLKDKDVNLILIVKGECKEIDV
jgi:hypothetical protein